MHSLPELTHLILTRFNVATEGNPAPSERWLRERFELFSCYTAPSVAAQTCSSFRWLLLCDLHSPAWLRDELQALSVGAPVETLFMETFSGAAVQDALRDRCAPGSILVTTRLDNDDAVGTRFVETIRSNAPDRFPSCVNLTNGFQLARGRLYRKSDLANPFISLFEEVRANERLRTVFLDQHQRLPARVPTVQISTEPQWLQVVHGGNLANRIRGVRVPARKARSHFPAVLVPRERRVAVELDRARTAIALAGHVVARPERIRRAAGVAKAHFVSGRPAAGT